MSEQDQLSVFHPPPGLMLPEQQSRDLAKLTFEVKTLSVQRAENLAEVDRRNALNFTINERLARLELEIRTALWGGNPPPGFR